MSLVLFDQEKDQQLKQLISSQGPLAAFLQPLLFVPDSSFCQHLAIIEALPKTTLSSSWFQGIRELAKLKLLERVRSFDIWGQFCQKVNFDRLIKLVKILTLEKEQQHFDFVEIILQRVKEPNCVFPYLEKIVEKEQNTLREAKESTQQVIKQLIFSSYKELQRLADEEQKKEGAQGSKFGNLNKKQKKLWQLRLFKLYSYLVGAEKLKELESQHLYANIQEIDDEKEIMQLLSIRQTRSQVLIEELIEATFEKKEGEEFQYKTQSKIQQKLITNQLISHAFEKNSKGYHSLQVQQLKQQEKIVILRFNILEFSLQALLNILPHEFFRRDDEDNYNQISGKFQTLFKNILLVLSKISEGWKFILFDLTDGKIVPRECSQEEVDRIEVRCLIIWENMFRVMRGLDNEDYWDDNGTYHCFFGIEENKNDNLIKTFETILKRQETPSLEVLKYVISLMRFYEAVVESNYSSIFKNKEFICLLVQKIYSRVEKVENKQEIPAELVWLFANNFRRLKDLELSIDQFILNSQFYFNFCYRKKFVTGDDIFYQKALFFYYLGRCKQGLKDCYIYSVMLQNYPAFTSYVASQLQKQLEVIHDLPGFYSNAESRTKIDEAITLFNTSKFANQSLVGQKLRNLLTSNPDIFMDEGDAKMKKMIGKLKISTAEEEKKIVSKLQDLIASQQLEQLDGKLLVSDIYTDNKVVQEFNNLLQYWKILLSEVNNFLNPDFCLKYVEILVSLKKVQVGLKEKIAIYLSGLDVETLKKLKQIHAVTSQCIFSRFFGSKIENIRESLTDTMAQSNKRVVCNFFAELNLLQIIEDNAGNDYLMRSLPKIFYKMFDVVSNYDNFGVLFYTNHKQKFLSLFKTLFARYHEKPYQNDWREEVRNPSFYEEVPQMMIESIEGKTNPLADYRQKLSNYVYYNVKESVRSVMCISTSSQSIFINGKQIKGYKNMMRVQQSIVVDFIKTQIDQFKIENIHFYNYLISQMLSAISNLDDYGQSGETQSPYPEARGPEINILTSKDGDKMFQETVVQFIQVLFQHRIDKERRELIRELITSLLQKVTDKSILEKERSFLLGRVIKNIDKAIINPEEHLEELKNQLQWLDMFFQNIPFQPNNFISTDFITNWVNMLKKFIPETEKDEGIASQSASWEEESEKQQNEGEQGVEKKEEKEKESKEEENSKKEDESESKKQEKEADGEILMKQNQSNLQKQESNIEEEQIKVEEIIESQDKQEPKEEQAQKQQVQEDKQKEEPSEKEESSIKNEQIKKEEESPEENKKLTEEEMKKKEEEQKEAKQQQKKQQLKQKIVEIGVNLLVRLVPDLSSEDNSEQQIRYTTNLLQLIAAIKDRVEVDNQNLLGSLVMKIAKNTHPDILKFSNYFLNGSSKQQELLCWLMQINCERQGMETDIKGHFFKKLKEKDEPLQCIQTKLEDFVKQFKGKYVDRVSAFRDAVEGYCQKKIKMEDGKEEMYLQFHHKQNFSHLKTHDSQMIQFKPPLLIRVQVQCLIEKLSKNVEQNDDVLNVLKKLILYYPVLLPSIIFHPMKVHKNKKRYRHCKTVFDFVVEGALNNVNSLKQFAGFLCLNHSVIVRGKEEQFLINQYLCFRMVQKIDEKKLEIRTLQLIFQLCDFRDFARACNARYLKGTSIRQKIQKLYIQSRKQFFYENDINLICLVLLVILIRADSLQKLKNVLKHTISGQYLIKEHCQTLEISPVSLIPPHEKVTAKMVSSMDQHKKLTYFQEIQSIQNMFQDKCSYEKVDVKAISLEFDIKPTEELLKKTGKLQQVKSFKSVDDMLQSDRSSFMSAYQKIQKWYKNKEQRSKNQYKYCNLFFDKNQDEDSQAEDDYKQKRSNEHSRFAPEDYAPQTNSSRQNDDEDEDNGNQLIKCFKEKKQAQLLPDLPRKKSLESATFELTPEMNDILNRINHNLAEMKKDELDLTECNTKREEEVVEFLKTKEIQTEFDLKESTYNLREFEGYCLSNLNRLQRLSSIRRNKVKRFEEQMLQQYIQRSASSDSIDYIIDTLDENYQQLAKLERKVSKQEEAPKAKKIKLDYLHLKQIDSSAFLPLGQELLFEVVLSFYFETQIISPSSLVPFIENINHQQKLINTLIYVLRDPFGREEFPKAIRYFTEDAGKDKQKEEEVKVFRANILRFISSIHSKCFYSNQDFLLEEISFQGLKGISLQPDPQLQGCFSQGKHIPVVEILCFVLDSNLDRNEKIKFFKGVSILPECLMLKIVEFFKELNIQLKERVDKRLGQNFYFFWGIRRSFKAKDAIATIMKNQNLKIKVREIFPITEQFQYSSFILFIFMQTGLYTEEQLKKMHQLLLKRQKKQTADLIFCNEVLKFYSNVELAEASGIKDHDQFYQILFQQHINQVSSIRKLKQFQFFRLTAYPELLSLKIKMKIFSKELERIKDENSFSMDGQIMAKREKGIFESAFEELRYKPNQFWLYQFQMKFMSVEGQVQSGYGDGVSKEWYTLVTKGMVNLNYGLFVKTSANFYYFSRQSWINPRHLQFFQFIGKLFALSIVREEFFLCPSFSILIYKMILGEQITIEDIKTQFDEGEVMKNIEKMREYEDDSLFCQTFVYEDKKLIAKNPMEKEGENKIPSKEYILNQTEFIEEEEGHEEKAAKSHKVLKVGEEIELLPGGSKIPVTKDNLQDFITLTKEKIFDIIVSQVTQQANAFIEGFKKVINPKYLKKFTAEQLRQLAQGSNKVSIAQIKEHAAIRVHECKKQLEWLWPTLEKLPGEDRLLFIQHWTGAAKIPAGGIKDMHLQIRERSSQKTRIFSHTCFNRIYLPSCQKEEDIVEAVKMAVVSVREGLSIQED